MLLIIRTSNGKVKKMVMNASERMEWSRGRANMQRLLDAKKAVRDELMDIQNVLEARRDSVEIRVVKQDSYQSGYIHGMDWSIGEMKIRLGSLNGEMKELNDKLEKGHSG